MATDFSHLLTAGSNWLAAVDGGGSRTRVRVWDRQGVLLGTAEAGPSGLGQGTAQAWAHIGEALALVGARLGKIVPIAQITLAMGLAGVNNAEWRSAFLAANPGYAALGLYSDAETALAGAHGGVPGILLISGTGSIAMARTVDGGLRSVGGWGFPVGDEGSGAALGLQAMRLAQQAIDGRRSASPLTAAVCAQTGPGADAMLDWCGRATQFHYASLAPLVFAHANTDALAAALLSDAVAAVQAMVLAVDPSGQLPLVLAGSVAQQLATRLPRALAIRRVVARGDALDGAITLFQNAFVRHNMGPNRPSTAQTQVPLNQEGNTHGI